MIGKISKGTGIQGLCQLCIGQTRCKTAGCGRSTDGQHSEYNGLLSSPADDEAEYPSACGTYLAQLCARGRFENDG